MERNWKEGIMRGKEGRKREKKRSKIYVTTAFQVVTLVSVAGS